MRSNHGFTLIELSIVLAIIGLIAAGITSGLSVLRDSNLKRIVSDAEHYKGILVLFKNRYQSLPGDFSRAGTIWGDDCAGATGGTDTCSGNGNRIIEHGAQDDIATTSESLRLWQHLSNADMAPSNLSGMPNSGCGSANNICAEAGVNIPTTSISNGGYYFYTDSATRTTALIVGRSLANSWNSAPLITPLEAFEIDKKIDDSVNNTGTFSGAGLIDGAGGWALSLQNATSNCYNAATSTRYNTATDDRTCGAVFSIGKNL